MWRRARKSLATIRRGFTRLERLGEAIAGNAASSTAIENGGIKTIDHCVKETTCSAAGSTRPPSIDVSLPLVKCRYFSPSTGDTYAHCSRQTRFALLRVIFFGRPQAGRLRTSSSDIPTLRVVRPAGSIGRASWPERNCRALRS